MILTGGDREVAANARPPRLRAAGQSRYGGGIRAHSACKIRASTGCSKPFSESIRTSLPVMSAGA
jgi:hypothetical protein